MSDIMEETSNITQQNIIETTLNDTKLDSLHRTFLTLNGLIGPVICCIGFLGNAINIYVFSRMLQISKSAIISFLLAISVVDLVVVLMYMLYGVLCMASQPTPIVQLSDITEEQAGTFVYLYYHLWHIPTNSFVTLSAWLTVSVMVFRFIAVYYPLRASRWCSVYRAKLVIASVVFIAIAIHIPSWFELQLLPIPKYHVYLLLDTELRSNKIYQYLYLVGCIGILNSVLPFIVCLLLSCLLIRTLKMSGRRLFQPDATRATYIERRLKEQRSISIMLIVVVFVYLICNAPAFFWQSAKFSMAQHNDLTWRMMRPVVDIFQIVNHSINFIVYFITNRKYRQHFHEIVYCRPTKDSTPQTSVVMSRKSSRYSVGHIGRPSQQSLMSGQVQQQHSSTKRKLAADVPKVTNTGIRKHLCRTSVYSECDVETCLASDDSNDSSQPVSVPTDHAADK